MFNTPETIARSQGRLAVILALVAGYVDSFALMNFRVFVSFMSGNTTQGGLYAGQGQIADALHQLLPIPCFLFGVIAGTLLPSGLFRNRVRGLCAMAASLLAISSAASYFVPFAMWSQIILLSVAMGAMNATITHVGGQPVSLGFVTGGLNNIGRHLALAAKGTPLPDAQSPWDTHWRRTSILACVWAAFLLGAVIAGAGLLFIGKWILLPPVLILCLLALCAGDATEHQAARPEVKAQGQ